MPFQDDDGATRTLNRPQRRSPQKSTQNDQQRIFKRRAIALGVGVLILFLMVITVRGCMDERKKASLKDYSRSVSTLVADSDKQVGQPFFNLLNQQENQSAQELEHSISDYRGQADIQLKQAEKLDVPEEMTGAQRSLLIALELRRNGLAAIAQRVRTAMGTNADAADGAIQQIAAQMQNFLASDVLYQTRVKPLIQSGLDKNEVGGVKLPSSRFLPNLDWLSTTTVATQLAGEVAAKRPKKGDPPLPGKHGSKLVSVSAGNVALKADSANRIPASNSAFTVRFLNEGDHEEFDIKVTLTISGEGAKPVKVEKTIPTVAKGATAEVQLQLPKPPAANAVQTIKVDVAGVPGEKVLENNKAQYQVMFTK